MMLLAVFQFNLKQLPLKPFLMKTKYWLFLAFILIMISCSNHGNNDSEGANKMNEISRSPEDLVSQVVSENHQYPDGIVLFLGTMFAPSEDRNAEGEGFTHKVGDEVKIASEYLGFLLN